MSQAIGLAKEIEATFNLSKPLEITKIHYPCVIHPPPSKFDVFVIAPTVTGDNGTAQSQEEDNLSANLISDIVEDRKEFLPEVFKDPVLSFPVPVPSTRVLCGYETHSTDRSPVLEPPLLDVVSTLGFKPQLFPVTSDSKSSEERKGSSTLSEHWVSHILAELTPIEIPLLEPPDRVVDPSARPSMTMKREQVLHDLIDT